MVQGWRQGRGGGGERTGRVESRAAEDRAVEVFARLAHRQLVETSPSTEVALEFVRGRCEVRWARLTPGEKAYFHRLAEDQQEEEEEERGGGVERRETKAREDDKERESSGGGGEQQVAREHEEEHEAREGDQGKEDNEDNDGEGSRREQEGSRGKKVGGRGKEEGSSGSGREERLRRWNLRPGKRKQVTGFHVFCARTREEVGREAGLVQGRGPGRWGLARELARR